MKKILMVGTAAILVFSSSYLVSNKKIVNNYNETNQISEDGNTNKSSFSDDYYYYGADSVDSYTVTHDDDHDVIDADENSVDGWVSIEEANDNLTSQKSNDVIEIENNILIDYDDLVASEILNNRTLSTKKLENKTIEGNGHIIYSSDDIAVGLSKSFTAPANTTNGLYLFNTFNNVTMENLYFINTPFIVNEVKNSTFNNVNFYDTNFLKTEEITDSEGNIKNPTFTTTDAFGIFFGTTSNSEFNYINIKNISVDEEFRFSILNWNQLSDNEASKFPFGILTGRSSNNIYNHIYASNIDSNKLIANNLSGGEDFTKFSLIGASESDKFYNIDLNDYSGYFVSSNSNLEGEINTDGPIFSGNEKAIVNLVYDSNNTSLVQYSNNTNNKLIFPDNSIIYDNSHGGLEISDNSNLYNQEDGDVRVKNTFNSKDFLQFYVESSIESFNYVANYISNDDSKISYKNKDIVSSSKDENFAINDDNLIQLQQIIVNEVPNSIEPSTDTFVYMTPYSYNRINLTNEFNDETYVNPFNKEQTPSVFQVYADSIQWNLALSASNNENDNEGLSQDIVDSLASGRIYLYDELNNESLDFAGQTNNNVINPHLIIKDIQTGETFKDIDLGYISNLNELSNFETLTDSSDFKMLKSFKVIDNIDGSFNYQMVLNYNIQYISAYIDHFVINFKNAEGMMKPVMIQQNLQNNEFVSTDKISFDFSKSDQSTITINNLTSENQEFLNQISFNAFLNEGIEYENGVVSSKTKQLPEVPHVSSNIVNNSKISFGVDSNNSEDNFIFVEGFDYIVDGNQIDSSQLQVEVEYINETTGLSNTEVLTYNGESEDNGAIYRSETITTESTFSIVSMTVSADVNGAKAMQPIDYYYIDGGVKLNTNAAPVTPPATESKSFDYVWVSVLAALFLLAILVVVYLSIRYRRNAYSNIPSDDDLNIDEINSIDSDLD